MVKSGESTGDRTGGLYALDARMYNREEEVVRDGFIGLYESLLALEVPRGAETLN